MDDLYNRIIPTVVVLLFFFPFFLSLFFSPAKPPYLRIISGKKKGVQQYNRVSKPDFVVLFDVRAQGSGGDARASIYSLAKIIGL